MFVNVDIKQPLYVHQGDPFVYIRDVYLDKARKTGRLLKIKTPQGTKLVSAKDWMTDAKYMEKEFKIKGKPMKLWGNYLRLTKNYESREEIN